MLLGLTVQLKNITYSVNISTASDLICQPHQHLVEQITTATNNKQYSVGVFIDLSKAFYTIQHGLLLKKHYKDMESEGPHMNG